MRTTPSSRTQKGRVGTPMSFDHGRRWRYVKMDAEMAEKSRGVKAAPPANRRLVRMMARAMDGGASFVSLCKLYGVKASARGWQYARAIDLVRNTTECMDTRQDTETQTKPQNG